MLNTITVSSMERRLEKAMTKAALDTAIIAMATFVSTYFIQRWFDVPMTSNAILIACMICTVFATVSLTLIMILSLAQPDDVRIDGTNVMYDGASDSFDSVTDLAEMALK